MGQAGEKLMADDIIRYKDIFQKEAKEGELLTFSDMYTVEYLPGEDELVNYRAYRRKRTIGVGEGGPVGESVQEEGTLLTESTEVDEALTLQQRMKRSRMMKRMKARIKIGRERAKRRMADKKKLEKRANRKARDKIIRKITKDIPKSELTYARKQEIEKRMEKPAFRARIQRLAKRMFPSIRKAEVQRKKG
jgi:hypothetical protein